MCFDEEEVFDDVGAVEEAEGEALGEEAGDDAGLEGASGGLFGVSEEGVSDAYVFNETLDLFGGYGAGVCAECLAYAVVFVEAQLESGLRVLGGLLSAFNRHWRPLDSYG